MHTLLNADFFDAQEDLEDNSIPLFNTDPPYLIKYKDWDNQQIEFMERWIDVVVRKMSPYGSMWAFMAKDNLFTSKICKKGFVNILEEFGTVHRENDVVWARQKGRGSSKHLKSQREDLIHFTKHPTKYTWTPLKMLREVIAPYVKDGRPRGWFLDRDGKRVRWTGLGNVWTYSSPQWNGKVEKQWHSAQKPIMILERTIRLSSNEGDKVVDPFSGSFSNTIACMLSKRQSWGSEINKEFYQKGLDRVLDFDFKNYVGYNDRTDKEIEEYMKGLNESRGN